MRDPSIPFFPFVIFIFPLPRVLVQYLDHFTLLFLHLSLSFLFRAMVWDWGCDHAAFNKFFFFWAVV